MAKALQVAGVPLIESGLPREDLMLAIATLYMEALHAKHQHQPTTILSYHLDFARAILDRSFYHLEHITNGLNATGKGVFSKVTGVKLQKAIKGSRKELMEWAGTDPKQDELLEARRMVKVWRDEAERQLGKVDALVEAIDQYYADGLVKLIHVNREHYIANRAGTSGVNLSVKGFHAKVTRPYIIAFLKLQQLRVELGEIQEPAWVDPKVPAPQTVPTTPVQPTAPIVQTVFAF
jgi:hypothetical protein